MSLGDRNASLGRRYRLQQQGDLRRNQRRSHRDHVTEPFRAMRM